MHLLFALLLGLPPAFAKPKPASEAPAAPVADAPTVPRFSRTPIGTCGCALYAPPGMVFEPPTKSEDNSEVWTGEVVIDGWHYGVIAVRFAEPFQNNSGVELEDLLVNYMDFIKGQANITASAGVGRGHTHRENPTARGVIDYWQDGAGDSWAVKGWVEPRELSLLYISGKGDYPWFNAQQLYLDGFRFD